MVLRFAAGDRFNRAGGAQAVSSHDLMHAFGYQRIADGIDRIVESHKLSTNRSLFGFRHWLQTGKKELLILRSPGCILLRLLPELMELMTIDDVVGGNSFNCQVFAGLV